MPQDIFQDKKRNAILLSFIACILLLALALYLIPMPTRIDLVLDAVKVDAEGNELGTFQIQLAGFRYDYLFQKSRLNIDVQPFDEYASIMLSDVYYGGQKIPGAILKYDFTGEMEAFEPDWTYVGCGGKKINQTYGFLASLAFSPDLDRWLFADHSGKVYYVASVSGTDATADLIGYFQLGIY